MHSRYLKEFIQEITYKNRNPRDLKALMLLDDISTNPEQLYPYGEKVYRCRIITDLKKTGLETNFFGFTAEESFVPPPNVTRDMRANYRNIPYLYCSDNPYVAIVEVRPRLGAKVSVATIMINEEIRLLDFTNKRKPTKMTDAKVNLFSDLSALFSKPIALEEDTIEYIPTQFIAEYAKNLGYDGIIYKSSLVPELYGEDSGQNNIVIFNYNKCIPIRSNIITVTNCQIDGKQDDMDSTKLKIKSYYHELLDIIVGNDE